MSGVSNNDETAEEEEDKDDEDALSGGPVVSHSPIKEEPGTSEEANHGVPKEQNQPGEGIEAGFPATAMPLSSPPGNDGGKGGGGKGGGGKGGGGKGGGGKGRGGKGGGGKGPPPRGKGGGPTPVQAFVMPARKADPKKAEKKEGKPTPMDFQVKIPWDFSERGGGEICPGHALT